MNGDNGCPQRSLIKQDLVGRPDTWMGYLYPFMTELPQESTQHWGDLSINSLKKLALDVSVHQQHTALEIKATISTLSPAASESHSEHGWLSSRNSDSTPVHDTSGLETKYNFPFSLVTESGQGRWSLNTWMAFSLALPLQPLGEIYLNCLIFTFSYLFKNRHYTYFSTKGFISYDRIWVSATAGFWGTFYRIWHFDYVRS